MDAENILKKIDELIKESRLDEAIEYMKSTLEEAEKEGSNDVALTIINEMIGFYRDTGNMSEAVKYCRKSEELLDRIGIGKTMPRAAAYLNCANAYRAYGDYDQSMLYFERALEVLEICGDESLYSSYYNNLSLLHQQMGHFEDSVECLKKALYIAEEKMHDQIRTAISATNLASSLLQLRRKDEARSLLEKAVKIFEGRTPSDFHYSAALSALANLRLIEGNLNEAATFFEMALSETELHMGQNNFYKIITDNLETVYKSMGGKPLLSGLDLCEQYFNLFFRPVLEKEFKDIKDKIACGLCGEGSECLGFDDKISEDHDFGPGFCIFIDDEISDADAERLKKAYELLPKTYMGIKRVNTEEAAGRVGVIRIKDYLKKVTGFDHIPRGLEEWQYTVDENLVLGVNGRIFHDPKFKMSRLRMALSKEQPMYVYFRKMAMQLELMAKHGQYAYPRAIKRGDKAAALIAKSQFITAAMRAAHIISGKYAPYSKWLYKSVSELKGFEEEIQLIYEISESAVGEQDISKIEKICSLIRDKLYKRGILVFKEGENENYLALHASFVGNLAENTVIADKIIDIEWDMFDKVDNEGGRAGCQDDWGTFSIMRRSQYYTYPKQLLQIILADFTDACKNGRNIITEKYGFMMESTVPEEFDAIKNSLPDVSEEKKTIINSIADIQVAWMEDFSKDYPKMAANARVIHEEEDTPFMTSYETYLKGELKTYHDDTLVSYGRFIAECSRKGINPVKAIMNRTSFFYGYESLEDCNG